MTKAVVVLEFLRNMKVGFLKSETFLQCWRAFLMVKDCGSAFFVQIISILLYFVPMWLAKSYLLNVFNAKTFKVTMSSYVMQEKH